MPTANPNPAFGANLEPFHGITTFMRLPASRALEGVDAAIVGVPFDSGASFRSGARFGPRSIREASTMLWGYNRVLDVTPAQALSIVDYGDVSVIPVDIRATMAHITEEVAEILDTGVQVVALGGDHSISLPLLRAHAARFPDLALIHFDAHPDMWDEEFEGQPYSHGTPFRRAVEESLIDPAATVQVGIRGPLSESADIAYPLERGVTVIPIEQALAMGVPGIIERMRGVVGQRPVYVSLDIDAVDPAFAPGTGTPEVGGFSSFQMLQLVRGLRGLNIVGFDLVEVSPPYDHGHITAILAANLAFEFLSLLALRKAGRD
ncbi:MAG TPA: agmatinase [Anaerolineae bacterium]|nr:agmatinase [Anaerolineae bacterium]